MTRSLRTLLCTGVALAALQAPARAADVTAADATTVETNVREWMGAMLGPSVKVSDRPVQVTSAGDHFDVVVPVKLQADGAGSELRVTATARPLAGGKWSIDGVRTSMPLRFTIDMPIPPKDGDKQAFKAAPVTYTVNLAGQDGQILLDPTFATPTTWTSSAKGGTIHTEGGVGGASMTQDTRMGPVTSVMTLRPAGPDRVDLVGDGTLQDYRMESKSADVGAIQIGMKLLRANFSMNGVSRSRAITISQSMAGFTSAMLAAMPAPGSTVPAAPPKLAPELFKTFVAALQDFASEMNFEESIEGLALKFGDYAATMDKAKLGIGAKSDKGILQARMDLGFEGIALPGNALGPFQALVPTEVSFRPFVSGVGVNELMRIATAASEKRDPTPEELAGLFARGGIVAGLESMSIEVAGATFTGNGKVVVETPEKISATAQITAEDFDDLMEKLGGTPGMAQFVPMIALVKGMGKTVDDKLVWNIAYKDGKVLVNNVDLAAMGGGAPPPRGGASKSPAPPGGAAAGKPQTNKAR